jgi:hypothetical protein
VFCESLLLWCQSLYILLASRAAIVTRTSRGMAGEELFSPLHDEKNQIRLISLLPKPSIEDEVSCDLITVSLDDCPPYEALSYAWGDPKVTKPILLSGQSFQVTTNLDSAIRHLRHNTDQPRLMWIDAICINQADNKERNHQVRHMRQIYQGAKEVVVWLGEEGSKAMKTIQALGRDEKLHWDTSIAPSVDEELVDLGQLFSLMYLLRRGWWERVWTVQESILAKELTFVCGGESCPGDYVFALSRSFFAHANGCCALFDQSAGVDISGELSNVFREVEELASFRKQASSIRLEQLLARFRHRKATDEHDKIYGFLGLAKDVDECLIDYDKSFTTAFEDMTLQMILSRGHLNILSQIFGKDNHVVSHPNYVPDNSYKLPSWVPDWKQSLKFWTLRDLNIRLETLDIFNACSSRTVDGYSPNARTSDNGAFPSRLVAFRGFPVDRIKRVGDIKWSSRNRQEWIYRQWRQMLESEDWSDDKYFGTREKYITGQDLFDAFWHTLCGGVAGIYMGQTPQDHVIVPAYEYERSLFDTWWRDKILNEEDKAAVPEPDKKYSTCHILGFETQVGAAAMNRRFFISEHGFIGLAPADAKEGDMVCILLGGKVPYVLRQDPKVWFQDAGGQNPCFNFVGDSYVQGIMNGEIIRSLESDEDLITFFIA